MLSSQQMVQKLVVIGLGMGLMLCGQNQSPQRVEVRKTERVDLSAGGTVNIVNSSGEVTVVGWDQPAVEVTTVKTSVAEYAAADNAKIQQEMDEARITTAGKGNEVTVSTDYTRHRSSLIPSAFGPSSDYYLRYEIKIPRDAKLTITHKAGEVNIEDVAGDIKAAASQGAIVLHLPENIPYAIDAHSKDGSVVSDFPGSAKRGRWLVGHSFTEAASGTAKKLDLRIGYGDILIIKERKLAMAR